MPRPRGERAAKEALYDGFATVAAALANGRRAEIVELLAQGERSVREVARAIDQSVANTSHHLRALASAGLVARRRDGTHVYYRLAGDDVYGLWAGMREVAETRLDGITELARDYLGDRRGLPTIGRDELAVLMEHGAVTVVDVRPAEEYRAGHLPGAVSVPPDRLDELLPTLPADEEVVAYCRGPYCVYADEAVRALLRAGRRARRLEGGFPAWAAEGRPVAVD